MLASDLKEILIRRFKINGIIGVGVACRKKMTTGAFTYNALRTKTLSERIPFMA